MKDKKGVFLTGATGLVGSYLLKILIQNGYRVYALGRSKDNQSAQERVISILKFWDETITDTNFLKNLKIIEGDIVYPDLGIKSKKDIETLISDTGIIFHSAALADITVPLEPIRKINVEGTRNVLDFALECQKRGGLEKVNYISTTYLVGTKKNLEFNENMLEVGQGFHNTYEQTKYEAELLVKQYLNKGLNISVFRPSMIIGDSRNGKTTDFRLFYTPLRFFSQEIFTEFPANLACRQNVINVDTVANAIFLLGEKEEARVYHIISPHDDSVEFLMKLVKDYFGFNLPKFTPLENFDFKKMTPAQRLLAEPYVPYFNDTAKFLSRETQAILKEYNFSWPEINRENMFRNFTYCEKMGFIKKKSDRILKNA